MSILPKLGNNVLEQFINVEKKIQNEKWNYQGLFIVHCFLNPSILGVSSAVLACKLETDLNFWAWKSKHYG